MTATKDAPKNTLEFIKEQLESHPRTSKVDGELYNREIGDTKVTNQDIIDEIPQDSLPKDPATLEPVSFGKPSEETTEDANASAIYDLFEEDNTKDRKAIKGEVAYDEKSKSIAEHKPKKSKWEGLGDEEKAKWKRFAGKIGNVRNLKIPRLPRYSIELPEDRVAGHPGNFIETSKEDNRTVEEKAAGKLPDGKGGDKFAKIEKQFEENKRVDEKNEKEAEKAHDKLVKEDEKKLSPLPAPKVNVTKDPVK